MYALKWISFFSIFKFKVDGDYHEIHGDDCNDNENDNDDGGDDNDDINNEIWFIRVNPLV